MEPKKIPTGRLLISGILLAVLFDILLYGSIFKLIPLGINAPLYILAFYIVMKYALRERLALRKFPVHIVFIVLLSITFALYNNAVLHAVSIILLLLLIGEHMMLSLRQNLYDPYTVFFVGDSLTFWFGYSFGGVKGAYAQYGEKKNTHGIKNIFIGVAVALPAAVIVLVLLQSADAAFSKLLEDVFGDIQWNDILGYSVVGIILFTLFSGLVWSAAGRRDPRLSIPQGAPTSSPSRKPFVFNNTASIIVYATLDVILGAFSLTQFLYLFAGRVPEGMTYAEYARNGFYQLLAVSLIVLLLVFLIVKFADQENRKHIRIKHILLTLLCAFTFILLISAFARMVLYEQAYNFTVSRIFTQFFMVVLGLTLLLTAFWLWLPRLPLRKLIFISGMACYAVLALMNLDGFIARENVKYQQKDADLAYLSTLSCDALPYYIGLADGLQDDIRYEKFEPGEEYTREYAADEYPVYDYQNNTVILFSNFEEYQVFVGLARQKFWLEKPGGRQYYNAGRFNARPLLEEYKGLFDTAQEVRDAQGWW